MHSLSAGDVVRAWEWGRDKHPVDRALALLMLAQPGLTVLQAASLTVGQRNARLLTLREMTLGPVLQGFAHCPQCHTPLEFSLEVAAIQLPEPSAQEYELTVDGVRLRFRLPDSQDLAAIVDCSEVETARRRLAERCVLQAQAAGQEITFSQLPEAAIPALAQAVSEYDPQAEMRFGLQCAACQHNWSALFDIVSYVWAEINALAKRLLQDVHTLAMAYGWSETDILALSAARRQLYLELVG
jgi:hypothetical protein